MTDEKIISKIRTLLKLSKATAHKDEDAEAALREAANAAAMAQRLMEKHNIQAATIAVEDDDATDRFKIQEHGETPLASGKRLAMWKVRLAQSLAGVNGCEVYFNEDDAGARDICLVGATADAENVGKLFVYLAAQIDRLAAVYGKPKGRKKARKRDRTALQSFREGAVDTVHWRLLDAQEAARAAARKEANKNCTALATFDKAIAVLDRRAEEAREYYEKILMPEELVDTEVERDWSAYAAGTVAGRGLKINGDRDQIEGS